MTEPVTSWKPNSKANKPKTVKSLATLIIDRVRLIAENKFYVIQNFHKYRKKVQKKRLGEEPGKRAGHDDEVRPVKKKTVYGVHSSKACGRKPGSDAVEAIAKTNNEKDFSVREAIFSQYRMELQYHFRNSSRRISAISKGFMKDHEHVANHFSWLSNSGSMIPLVEANLIKHIGDMEKVLKYKKRLDSEYLLRFVEIDNKCEVDYNGSPMFKYISILRMTADDRDSDGSCLIRLDSDGVAKTASPHIVAIAVDDRFVFEIHAEGDRLIGNLNLVTAISTLLHLAFILDLHYPVECQTVWDVIQKNVAKFGCIDGTRATGGKGKAQRKFDDYLADLGRAYAYF